MGLIMKSFKEFLKEDITPETPEKSAEFKKKRCRCGDELTEKDEIKHGVCRACAHIMDQEQKQEEKSSGQ